MGDDVTTALRLGWQLAESRGRSWPQGPQPVTGKAMPTAPANLLPLRFQRDAQASRTESISTLVAQAERLHITGASGLSDQLRGEVEDVDDATWVTLSKAFQDTDAYIQDELAQADDGLANAYLLGRGLAECYWGMGRNSADWRDNPGASPVFLLGDDRRQELSRMLGRLRSKKVHELTPSAIDGSLQAWGAVVTNTDVPPKELDASLHEQARRWYQLLVLGQDPTTLVPPGARLRNRFYLRRTLRAFLPQVLLGVLALVLITAGVSGQLGAMDLTALLPSGLGALGVAGLLAKGQSAAQKMVARLHQDAYTDLVALHVTSVPAVPSGPKASARAEWLDLEKLVRQRLLTPPTAAPPAG